MAPLDRPLPKELLVKALSTVEKADLDKPDSLKTKGKIQYYEPIRLQLMSLGFVVGPSGVALGAVFPEADWVRDVQVESEFLNKAKSLTDALVVKYRLLGDDETSVTRLPKMTSLDNVSDNVPPLLHKAWASVCSSFISAVGCLCVSWTRHRESGKPLYVPVLGLSGVIESATDDAYFQKYVRVEYHLRSRATKTD